MTLPKSAPTRQELEHWHRIEFGRAEHYRTLWQDAVHARVIARKYVEGLAKDSPSGKGYESKANAIAFLLSPSPTSLRS
jgi:hypothetical protein